MFVGKLEEPYDERLSRTVLWEARGEIPLAYSTRGPLSKAKKNLTTSFHLDKFVNQESFLSVWYFLHVR